MMWLKWEYHIDLKFSDRQVWANSVDPDQTAPEVCPGSTLFAILSASFGCNTFIVKLHCSNFGKLQQCLRVSTFLDFVPNLGSSSPGQLSLDQPLYPRRPERQDYPWQ